MRKYIILSMLAMIPAGCALFLPLLPTESGVADLVRFKSGQEVLDYVAERVSSDQQQYRGGGLDLFFLPMAPPPSPDGVFTMEDAADGGAAPTNDGDFSTTNLQEAGVDESDFVKNDGQYIYVLRSDSLRIVKATPPGEMEQVASVPIEGYGDALYLTGDRAVALTQLDTYYYYDYGEPGDDAVPPPAIDPEVATRAQEVDIVPSDGPRARITIIDVSDPTNPIVLNELTIEGSLNTSRVTGGKLHVVLNHWPVLPMPLEVEEIREIPVEQVLPGYEMKTDGQTVSSGNLVEPTDMYHPVDPDGYNMTVVATINLADDDPEILSTAVMANAGTVYASTQALYLTDTDYAWWGQFRNTTDVYKFDLTGDQAEFVAAGSFNGRLLNQYSLGEYEGHLRVATTSEDTNEPVPLLTDFAPAVSRNNVYILAQEGDQLVVVGSIEGLAPGEQIYAARFVGTRGFLVTFVQIDPLFTLDLSDPRNPLVVGKLKVEGVSDYIHILDENHLLTVGRDAIPQGDNWALFQGVQLSIFDITDFADPTLTKQVKLGTRGTNTEVQYNPKALTFLPSQNLMALPINLYEESGAQPWDYGQWVFSGIYVYEVTAEDGFDLLGQISTRGTEDYYYYYGDRSRGVFIGENVYAVTEAVVRAAPVSNIGSDPTWSLDLPE